METPLVLVVEDDRSTRDILAIALRDSSMEVTVASSGEEAIDLLDGVDVVVTDLMLGTMTGLEICRHVQERCPEIPVILVTAFATIESAVEAMREGAFDYLSKPIDLDRLELMVRRAYRRRCLLWENRQLKHEIRRHETRSGIVGQSAAIRRLLEQIEQIAPTSASVLVQGESGTGKELVATAVHNHSQRSSGPLVKVNCAALAPSLIESELFGHERGAFTGAHQQRKGRFELADGGTLFLDEVGDLEPELQLKLLRAIQEREVERVGGQRTIAVDVRVIAATNQDLERAMREGRFREELYYRLKVVTLEVPPLRERVEDIHPLLEYYCMVFCKEHGRQLQGFTEEALERLCAYHWPGNVRELRNQVESLVVTARSDQIAVHDLPRSMTPQGKRCDALSFPLGLPVEEVERRYILRTLAALDQNKTRAAEVLGISRKTLYRRLQDYGVANDD